MRLFKTDVRKKVIHIIRFVFLWVIALQILNLSTDAIDFHPMASVSISEFNDLNSITEYISEIVLEHVNAFPESEQGTNNKTQNIKHVDIKIYKPTDLALDLNTHYQMLVSYIFPLDETDSYLFSKEIIPPPPKA